MVIFEYNPTLAIDTSRICRNAFDIIKTSPVPIDCLFRVRTYNLPPSQEHHLVLECENEDETNCAILSYFQLGPQESHYQEVLHQILFRMLEEPAFDFLRTKEQLGYVAYSRSWNVRNILGGAFIIQTSK